MKKLSDEKFVFAIVKCLELGDERNKMEPRNKLYQTVKNFWIL